MDRLGELQTLIAIVDGGSLAAAARRLQRSPPTVSRDLMELERRVGSQLVERSTRHCRPTDIGLRLAEDARQLIAGYDEAIEMAVGEVAAPSGTVKVTAPVTFGIELVAPLVTQFIEAQTAIVVDLQLLDRVVDLFEEDFDLAVRIGSQGSDALMTRAIGHVRRFIVASPAYLQANGTPLGLADLAGHQVVEHEQRGGSDLFDSFGLAQRMSVHAVRRRFKVNHPDAALQAAREGGGLVGVLSHQVANDLRDGRLVRVLEELEPAPISVALVWPQSRGSWRRVRLLRDHLGDGLRSALSAAE